MSVREDLKAFVDGELSPQRMAEVRAAIDADPALQAEVAFMKALGDEIRSLSEEPEILGMERVLGAVKGRSARSPWWRVRPIWAGTAACLLFLAVSAALIKPLSRVASDVTSTKSADVGAMKEESSKAMPAGSEEQPKAESAAPSYKEYAFRAPAETKAQPDLGDGIYGLRYRKEEAKYRAGFSSDSNERRLVVRKSKDNNTKPRPVRAAGIVVHVDDLADAERKATQVAAKEGGFVQTDPTLPAGDDKTSVVICVPGANFDSALSTVRSIGTVVSEDHTVTDSPRERQNLAVQLSNLRSQLAAWVRRLTPKTHPDSRVAEGRVRTLNVQIQNVAARRKALEADPSFSNIVAVIERKPARRSRVASPAGPKGPETVPEPSGRWLFGSALVALGAVLVGALAWWLLRRR